MGLKISTELQKRLDAVTAKRAKTVIDHIRKHGRITTEELRDVYGYNHPPRAARDVREQGIPLKTTKVKGSDGRSIGAYIFGDLGDIEHNKLGGRQTFSKEFKDRLYEANSGRCDVCLEHYEKRYLQIDHRIPYEVAGEAATEDQPGEYMLLCGSCNRAKSWSCEHCENWQSEKSLDACRTCYWAMPDNYSHMALQPIRRMDLTWAGQRVEEYDAARQQATREGVTLPDYVKQAIRHRLNLPEQEG